MILTYPAAPSHAAAGARYAVKAIIRMTSAELLRPAIDLDNLAKPILDTLFTSDNVGPGMSTGVLLSVNDTFVFRLELEKVLADPDEERGADITVVQLTSPG